MANVSTSARQQFPVHYHTPRVKALEVFYREAGPPKAPVVLLLHGFPTSSNMFRNLIPRLASSFHVVAPDYPGFGQSSMPDRENSAYTFENLTNVVEALRHLITGDMASK
jgi:pimeloyl-ACP methyl ester carboxylesterase